MAPGGVPGGARLLCLGALVLVWAVPVDPQWRVFRAASSVLAPSYSRDITVPVGELRYPGASRKAPRSSPASGQDQQQPPRSRRQYKSSNSYSKQSTFSLLRRLISETANETRTAFNQIGDILGSQFSDSQSRTTTARTTTTSTTTSSSLSSDAASVPRAALPALPPGRGRSRPGPAAETSALWCPAAARAEAGRERGRAGGGRRGWAASGPGPPAESVALFRPPAAHHHSCF